MRIAVLVSHQPAATLELSQAWASAGDDVTVVLLDAAASIARPGHQQQPLLSRAHDAGVAIWVHDDAIRRRGLQTSGVKHADVVTIDDIVDLITDRSDRVQWW